MVYPPAMEFTLAIILAVAGIASCAIVMAVMWGKEAPGFAQARAVTPRCAVRFLTVTKYRYCAWGCFRYFCFGAARPTPPPLP
jgi:hypothetical protein